MTATLTTTDEELVRAAQAGSLEAFDALYERYLPVVYRRVRVVIPADDVEDVTQEVFIAAMRSLKGFRGQARFSTWLRTLVNHKVADFYRARKHSEPSLTMLENDEPDRLSMLSAPDDTAHLDDCIVLQRALCELPEHYREVILLRFAEGLQFDEIAALQGVSLEATKSLFRRSIAALQERINHG
jgi:RNA polymerase sigma-70 factor (ECF subfamily)